MSTHSKRKDSKSKARASVSAPTSPPVTLSSAHQKQRTVEPLGVLAKAFLDETNFARNKHSKSKPSSIKRLPLQNLNSPYINIIDGGGDDDDDDEDDDNGNANTGAINTPSKSLYKFPPSSVTSANTLSTDSNSQENASLTFSSSSSAYSSMSQARTGGGGRIMAMLSIEGVVVEMLTMARKFERYESVAVVNKLDAPFENFNEELEELRQCVCVQNNRHNVWKPLRQSLWHPLLRCLMQIDLMRKSEDEEKLPSGIFHFIGDSTDEFCLIADDQNISGGLYCVDRKTHVSRRIIGLPQHSGAPFPKFNL